MEDCAAPRVISVRDGKVEPVSSWLYVWIDVDASVVVYIGATGLDPELRAHLHLTHHDPSVGRVRAEVPHIASGKFDALAFPLPKGLARPEAKRALMAALTAKGLWTSSEGPTDAEPLIVRMAEAVQRHLDSGASTPVD